MRSSKLTFPDAVSSDVTDECIRPICPHKTFYEITFKNIYKTWIFKIYREIVFLYSTANATSKWFQSHCELWYS